MQISQCIFTAGNRPHFDALPVHRQNQLILVFGSTALLSDSNHFHAIRSAFPGGLIVGCSTAGEIHGTEVSDDTLVVTAVNFEHTRLHFSQERIVDSSESFAVGLALAESLPADELVHVLVFSDGLNVNGTALVRGMREGLSPHVEITGGLSADGASFQKTLVCANDVPAPNQVAVVGLYGHRIKVGYGSLGGWDPFGPEREITRAQGNVLFDLDRKPALELYKRYLGEHAAGLPATGLLFPLALRYPEMVGGTHGGSSSVVRTILGIDEEHGSMTFAGDMPEGGYVRLMKANFERLIDGASGAARISMKPLQDQSAQLALLISCVGRKLVLQQRVEEEVEGVRDVLGDQAVFTGFYSYGEISPHMAGDACELHNQTMTITTFFED
ncbi:MAG: FIST N-terminal domain-containing protein [Giesbergeria sp.]